MNRLLPAMVAVWLAAQATVAPATMILQSYAAQRHDRFYDPTDPNKAFLGEPYDFSGVGRNTRWATMISPSYFLTAAHYRQGIGTALYFYTTNDPAETPQQRLVESGQRIAASDLWLGKLAAPVSPDIEFYPILGLPDHPAYDDLEIYTFGLSVDRFSATATTVRLGRNHIDPGSIAPVTDGEPPGAVTGETFLFDFDDPGGAGDDESYLQGGDSGGPSLVIHQGLPAVVGIHWFIWEDELDTDVYGSGDTFVPEYIDELNAAMVGEQVTVVSSILTWDGQGRGNFNSATRWTGGQSTSTGPPDATNPAVVRVDEVSVAADSNAYSVLIHQSGRLAIAPGNTLEVVKNAVVADGTLDVASAGVLDVGDRFTMQGDAQYVCQIAGPDNGRVVARGDVYLDGALALSAVDKLRPVPPGELQWFGDETRTIVDAAAGGQIFGTFSSQPPTVPANPDPANHGQGHLGYGVFLTDDGLHGRGVTYGADTVKVDLLQAADGDTNGDRTIDSHDIQAILGADKFATGIPGDWTEGDFTGDTLIDSHDIQALLATARFATGPYTPLKSGIAGSGGQVHLIVTPDDVTIDVDGVDVNGYLLSSARGIFTGEAADNLGWFREDTDVRIGGGFGFTLTDTHPLGDVIGDGLPAAYLPDDLTFTYTIEDRPGIFHGVVVVPEPATVVMLLFLGAACLVRYVIRKVGPARRAGQSGSASRTYFADISSLHLAKRDDYARGSKLR